MKNDLISDIWASFLRLPTWVQVWVGMILVPVNLAALAFAGHPNGAWVAVLAIAGMAPNLWVMARDRGFSRLMAVPHLIFWTPLVVLILMLLGGAHQIEGPFRAYLVVLLAVDLVSLAFDIHDARRWWNGDRGAA